MTQPKTASHMLAIPIVTLLIGLIAAPLPPVLLRLASRRGLDDSSSKVALQVAVDVQTKLLESGCSSERPRAFERLKEILERWRQLTVGWQGDVIDVQLRARDRLAVEQRQA